MWVIKDKQSLSQMGKVTSFKSRVDKMILGQTTSEFTVITLFDNVGIKLT